MDKVRLSLLAFWLLVPLCSFAQASGVLPGFNPGNNWGNVQDSVYQRHPVFAHRLDPEASITIDRTVDPAWDAFPLITISRLFHDVGQGYHPVPEPADLSEQARCAWDDQNLCLLIEVLERGDLKPGYYSVDISGPQVFRAKLIVK